MANKAIWHNKGKVRSYGELFKVRKGGREGGRQAGREGGGGRTD